MKRGHVPSVPDPRVPIPGFSILIADDYPGWRIQIRNILSSTVECRVIFEATDGEQAFQKAVELRPRLVLLDIEMPGMNGIQVGHKIRQHCPGTHIVFVTQNLNDDVRKAAMELGALGYVLKSNVTTELVPVIAAALRSRDSGAHVEL